MNKLVKNTSIYTIGRVLPQAASFLLLPVYTNYLSPSEYGIVNSMQVLNGILAVLFTLAIDRSIFRLYFDYETEETRRDFLGTITISLTVISSFVFLFVLLFSGYVEQIFKSIDFYPYYFYAILAAFFSIFSTIPNIYLQLKEKAGQFVILSLIQFALNTGFVLWFVVVEGLGAEGMLKGILYGTLVILPLFAYISFKIINFKFNVQIFKESLSFSLPIIPGIITAWILELSDRLFIERYFDLYDVGIYSLGYKIAGLILVFTTAFNVAYNPVFYKLANSKDQIFAKRQLYNYNNVYSITIIIAVFFLAFFSKEIIEIFANERYLDAYKIVPLICFAYLISQLTGLFNLMIYQEKKVIKLMYVSFIAAFLNIFLNFLLVPVFGVYGAAYATILSFIVVFILTWWLARKYYYIPFNWTQISLIFIPLLIVVICEYFFLEINISTHIRLTIKLTFCVFIGLIIIKKYYPQIKNIINKS